jgi:hypothetical protein
VASSAGRAKRDREKARQERQALKRERRLTAQEAKTADAVDENGSTPKLPQDELLARLAALHEDFRNGTVTFDDFETSRDELLKSLDV